MRLVFCILTAIGLVGGSAFSQQTPQLVPANFNPRSDSLGFNWDIQQQGHVQNGSNMFSNACHLRVNGNLQFRQAMMTADGSEFVIFGSAANLEVTRRVRVDVKNAFVRYVEILRNPGTTTVTASVTLQTSNNNGPFQAVISDTGSPVGAALGAKDSGLIGVGNPQQSQGSALFYLGAPSSKHKPMIQNEQNHRLQYTYNVTVPAGKTVALLHGIAQRHLPGIPDPKAAAELFKPFRNSRLTADLPADLRKVIVNYNRGSLIMGGDGAPLAHLESLDVEHSSTDILAIGNRTRLQGTAACDGIALETRYGKLNVSGEDVAAVVGAKCALMSSRIVLRDGQVLIGKVAPQNLKFTMNTGLEVGLSGDKLDRLVFGRRPQDGTPSPGAVVMLETLSGERLALSGGNGQRLAALTPWGERQPLLDDLLRIAAADDLHGHYLFLRDGSRLFAFLDDVPLKLPTLAFGLQDFPPSEIRAITAAGMKEEDAAATENISQAHVTLTGGNLLVGRIDLPVVHFLSAGQAVPVPPEQMKLLRSSGEDDESAEGGTVFEAELWDGSTVRGALEEKTLPIRSPDRVSQVPVRDVLEAHVPAPTVPETLRVKIAELIRDLGHPEYQSRESANRSLSELGDVTRLQLQDSLGEASDPEVRRRIEALLAEIKD